MKIEYILTDEKNEDFKKLTEELDNYYIDLFGDLALKYQPINKIKESHHVCLAYNYKTPIACSSFKIYNDETIELKRFYVIEKYQNKKIASKMLNILENLAKELGYNYSILETGAEELSKIPINFYKKNNYEIIENYEPFIGDENVVCMKKKL